MPRIIKKGKPSDEKIIGIYICTGEGNGNIGCGSELEIYLSDLYTTSLPHQSVYDTHPVRITTFTCPVCSAETDIKYNGGYSGGYLPSRNKHVLHNKKNKLHVIIQEKTHNDIDKIDQLTKYIKKWKYNDNGDEKK